MTDEIRCAVANIRRLYVEELVPAIRALANAEVELIDRETFMLSRIELGVGPATEPAAFDLKYRLQRDCRQRELDRVRADLAVLESRLCSALEERYAGAGRRAAGGTAP